MSVSIEKLRPWSRRIKSRLDQITSGLNSYLSQVGQLPGLDIIRREVFAPQKRILLILSLLMVLTPFTAVQQKGTVTPRVAASVASFGPIVQPLMPLGEEGGNHEVFGFAPYWTLNKLDDVDFNTLTTLAYFSFTVDSNGNFVNDDGYSTFRSPQATALFKKAHSSGTRVVLTLTQMHNGPILALMDDPDAQANLISQAVGEVQARGIDGINVDLEYSGDPGQGYRDKFSRFVENLTNEMHRQNPNSKVTVSVYASAIKEPKIYDIGALGRVSDGIFMMAYDYASVNSDVAMPTAPLYGFKEGKYWYDVSTAVDDFLTQMPAKKLILGVPWYGVNFAVPEPGDKAPTYRWGGVKQTYRAAIDSLGPDANILTGWDDLGKVGWKAYYAYQSGSWRMLFEDDPRSLAAKFDFAKSKNLGGIGMWALGMDAGKTELWDIIREKFGNKLADTSLKEKPIYEQL